MQKILKKLLCFDLDGTLTQHRSKLEKENAELLNTLQNKYKVIMVGAGGSLRVSVKFAGRERAGRRNVREKIIR